MDHSGDPGGRLDAKNPLSKWVDEMQGVMQMITTLMEDSDRHRAVAESAQREHGELQGEPSPVTEMEGHQSEAGRLREGSAPVARGAPAGDDRDVQRERDDHNWMPPARRQRWLQ
jgi:hypothetical protein